MVKIWVVDLARSSIIAGTIYISEKIIKTDGQKEVIGA